MWLEMIDFYMSSFQKKICYPNSIHLSYIILDTSQFSNEIALDLAPMGAYSRRALIYSNCF